jgi:hypothetical protein
MRLTATHAARGGGSEIPRPESAGAALAAMAHAPLPSPMSVTTAAGAQLRAAAGAAAAGGGAKRKHTGFWRFPPVGHIKGEWSCCGSTRYHDQFCV